MQKIKLLSDKVINQIAAGEVIERPASVVKELVENAIDAQATEISVQIESGGKSFIRITDNGYGMDAQGIKMCLQRHATSKITSAEDLIGVNTNGFRGEAIPSIASVSKLSVESRIAEKETGLSITLEDNPEMTLNSVARPVGTTFTVQNLFYNTPVRANFLNSDASETNKIIDIVTRIALAHPEIRFELSQKGHTLFTGVKGNLETRLAEVLGTGAAKNMIVFSQELNEQEIYGFVMKPEKARPRRNAQYIYLGKRPISSPAIIKAVQKAYEPYGIKGTPAVVIFLELADESFDVNVHPTKKEVRFSTETNIFSLVHKSIRQTLLDNSSSPVIRFVDSDKQEKETSEKDALPEQKVAQPPPPKWNEPKDAIAQDFFSLPEYGKVVPLSPQLFKKEKQLQSTDSPPIGNFLFFQWANTYIVSEDSQGLIFIHQNAAHQRILYENALISLENQSQLPAQELLFPDIFDLSPTESQLLSEHNAELSRIGFHAEAFGNNAWKLRSIPAHIAVGQGENSFRSFLNELSAPNSQNPIEEIIAKAYALGAAIQTGASMNNDEMINLFEQLIQCTEPFISPFGLPTLMRLPVEDINKKFKRT